MYFFDWLECYQDFDFDLPIISDSGFRHYDFTESDSMVLDDVPLGVVVPAPQPAPRQKRREHEGSYSTKITVHVKGRRIHVSGNPSRFNRLDNLFGLQTLEQCVNVYNGILESLGLPPFTKCVNHGFIESIHEDGSIHLEPVMAGCHITTLHITSNQAVGSGNSIDTYIRAISMLPWRNRKGRLHADGKTADWVSNLGNAREIYASVYDKAHEIMMRSLPKVKRKFGEDSPEYQYLFQLHQYCASAGVARFELKLNSPFLKKNYLNYFGISDFTKLDQLFEQFLNLDQKMRVSAMNIQTLTETLINEGICSNTKAANITALYAINWMNGQKFDLNKSQTKTHRARLRKIGIDIAKPCNLTIFSPVIVKEVIEIERKPLQVPSFYKYPNHLRLVA